MQEWVGVMSVSSTLFETLGIGLQGHSPEKVAQDSLSLNCLFSISSDNNDATGDSLG